MTKQKLVITPEGVNRIDLTPEELTQIEIDKAQVIEEENTLAAAAAQKATDKANAKAKLIAGEPLTEDEANTIVL